MKTGIDLITKERARQITDERYTLNHDDEHTGEELARAAACYATPTELRDYWPDHHIGPEYDPPRAWPFDPEYWKPTPENRVRELVKAGALIAAEIDRLLRAEVEP